jgi:hypothetical protein
MSTEDEKDDVPEAGDVRIGENGQVEVFDGEVWGRYRPLLNPGGGPIFRLHDFKSHADPGDAR